MTATLKLHQKKILNNSIILEMKLWEVPASHKYPDAVRYSVIVIDTNSHKRVLMDNHSPKGHHYHLDDEEFDYAYVSIDQLVKDFKALAKNHMGVKI